MRKRIVIAILIALAICLPAIAQGQQRIPADVEVIRDVEYGNGGDVSLKLDIVRPKTQPKDPMPFVIFIHGGGWKAGDKQTGIPHLIPLAQKGYFCATINYRLTDVAIFPAQIEDCKCAIRWMRAHAKEYNADPKRIGVWGGSAGGHLVALLGTSGGEKDLEGKGGWEKESSSVQAVCDWFGPTDFLKIAEDAKKRGMTGEQIGKLGANGCISKLVGGKFWEKPDVCKKAGPITYVTKDDPPFLIMHGDKDNEVPVSQSQVFYDALKKVGVDATLKILKGAGHGFGPKFDADKPVVEFFDRHLRKGNKPK